MPNSMKVEIRRGPSDMYQAMGKWFVHEHNNCPKNLISRVYEVYAATPNLDVTQLGHGSFVFPEPKDDFLKIHQSDRQTIDDAIRTEIERYQIN
jgi:hypothetical protein